MIIQRFFPHRWARIAAWTGAAVAWATSLLVIQAAHPATDAPVPAPAATPVPVPTAGLASMPEAPDQGLLVLRFTPTPTPPPQVITRTVTVAAGSGGGRATPAPVVSSGS